MRDANSYKYTGRELVLMKKLHKLQFPMFELDKEDRKNLLAAKREYLRADYLRNLHPYLCLTAAIVNSKTREKIRPSLISSTLSLDIRYRPENYGSDLIPCTIGSDAWLLRIVWINKLLRQKHKNATSPQIPLITDNTL